MQNTTVIPFSDLVRVIHKARQVNHGATPYVDQNYDSLTSGLDLEDAIVTAEIDGLAPLEGIAKALTDFFTGDLSLDAVTDPSIGNYSLYIDIETQKLSFDGDIDTAIKTLDQVSDHVLDCYDGNPGHDGWANPWEAGICSGDDDVDYKGSYLVVIMDLLTFYKKYHTA